LHICGIDFKNNFKNNKENFNVYQGFFYSNNFFRNINLIFPTKLYTENTISYLNLEGRYRFTQKIINSSSFIAEGWKLIQAILILKKIYYYKNFSVLKNFYIVLYFFSNLIKYICYFFVFIQYLYNFLNKTISHESLNNENLNLRCLLFVKHLNKFSNTIISRMVVNHYLSDPICMNSKILNLINSKIKIYNFNQIN
jgi:hypothetical protein